MKTEASKPHHVALILDSGVGGLSIARAMRWLTPRVQLIYIADNAAFPYGNKSAAEMQHRLQQLLQAATQKYQPDIGVIACNSASTAVLGTLRGLSDIPLVGVVPAIKPAVKISQTKSIGVLATEHTASSLYTKSLIDQYAMGCKVTVYGSATLAGLAEEKYKGTVPNADRIQQELLRLTKTPSAPPMDTVVLACTHFPLLANELKEALPQVKFWVDSSEAIAKRVEHCLENTSPKHRHARGHKDQNLFISTDSRSAYSNTMLSNILGHCSTDILTLP